MSLLKSLTPAYQVENDFHPEVVCHENMTPVKNTQNEGNKMSTGSPVSLKNIKPSQKENETPFGAFNPSLNNHEN